MKTKKLIIYLKCFLLLTSFISLTYADTNGVWHNAEDIKPGIIGEDEQGPNSKFKFINPVHFNTSVGIGTNPDSSKLHVSGLTIIEGLLNMSNHRITNVADPVNPKDLTTKFYVDTKTSGLATTAYVNSKTNNIVNKSYIDTKISGLATMSYVNTKTIGLATINYVDAQISAITASSSGSFNQPPTCSGNSALQWTGTAWACKDFVASCSDDCSYSGQKSCSNNYAKTCGNFDSDSCLEWSSKTHCSNGCSNNVCKSCSSRASYTCYNGNIWYYDSCGQRESVRTYCNNGCSGSSCLAPPPSCGAYSGYINSALCGVNYNTGRTQTVGTVMSMTKLGGSGNCPSTATCSGSGSHSGWTWVTPPACRSHASSTCSSGDMYWYNSCGQRGEKKQECGSIGCTGTKGCNYRTTGLTVNCNDNAYASKRLYQDIGRRCAEWQGVDWWTRESAKYPDKAVLRATFDKAYGDACYSAYGTRNKRVCNNKLLCRSGDVYVTNTNKCIDY